jgi:hypothetical protein
VRSHVESQHPLRVIVRRAGVPPRPQEISDLVHVLDLPTREVVSSDSYPVEPLAMLTRRRYAIALTSVRDFLTLALARLRVLGIAHRIPRASWGRRAGMFGFHL